MGKYFPRGAAFSRLITDVNGERLPLSASEILYCLVSVWSRYVLALYIRVS